MLAKRRKLKLKNSIKTLAMWLIIFVIFIIVITSILDNSSNKLAYSELIAKIEAGEVLAVEELLPDYMRKAEAQQKLEAGQLPICKGPKQE